jgi:uncharacterized protein (DUF1501 family)
MVRRVLDRRAFLFRSGALGCSLAASPLMTPVTFAAAPWDTRLVVIILRGAMDGLDVVQPYGDPDLTALRPTLVPGEAGGAADLDGFYALHPGLGDLLPLWDRGELSFAHAVSTPYRDKRSHFDGQDLLEAGTGFAPGEPAPRDGWLNRMLQAVPGITSETAYAVGAGEMLLLNGAAPAASWSPDQELSLSPQARRLIELVYETDPLFHANVLEAIQLTAAMEAEAAAPDPEDDLDEETAQAAMMAGMTVPEGNAPHLKLAEFTAGRLRGEARVAAFSINGWDTHANQGNALKKPLTALAETILSLRAGLGSVWGQTAVLAVTEFGRTARENGTRGTDHGTGGAMVMAGGAIRGGRVHGIWPGLAEADLYARRDLMPTADVRAFAAQVMRGITGLDARVMEQAVFPGVDLSAAPEPRKLII